MPLFPNYQFGENDSNGRRILQEMQDNYTQDSPMLLYWQGEANNDVRTYVGDPTVAGELYGQSYPAYQQKFVVNLTKRLVEMPVGHQIDNRKSITAVPIEGADQKTADQLTKIGFWNDRQAMVHEHFTDAFRGACITGLSWITTYLDYTNDPLSGDLFVDVVNYNDVIFDPFFKKLDMSDCRYWWRRDWISKDQALALLPAYKELVVAQQPRGMDTGIDGKFQYAPQTLYYTNLKLLTYDEYWYRSYRTQKLIVDEMSGRYVDFKGSDSDLMDFKNYMEAKYPDNTLRILENMVPTTRRCVVLNGTVVVDEPNPYGIDEYPHIPVTAYYTKESNSLSNRIQGIVRGARDPQFLFNKFLISTMDTIDAQPHSGFMAKEDSVVNPKSLHKTGPGQVIWLKKNTNLDDVRKIDPPNPPVAQMQLVESLQKLMIETTGTNETNMGLSDDKVAGVLNMLNQRAGLTTLNSLYDNLDKAMKLFGAIRIKIVQNKWLPQKIERILGEQPTQEFYDRAFGKYDCAIEDGYNTTTQRQLAFAQALKLKEVLGDAMPNSFLIEKSTLQDKNDLLEMMKQTEQAQAMQAQQQAQLQQQETAAAIELANSQSAYQRAGERERQAKVVDIMAMRAEHQASAQKEQEQALLTKLKALEEIEMLGIDKINRYIQIAHQINQLDMQVNQVPEETPPPGMPEQTEVR